MAPTICSGKKRESRTILNTNIRRNGQGSHQLNQALSNIVNYVAKGSLNPRVSAALRIHSQSDKSNGTTSNQRQQQISFLSDNAVTSSAHLDTENSFDLRLANDSTSTYGGSNTTNPSSLSSLSPSSLAVETETEAASSHNERTSSSSSSSSSTSPYQKRRFQRYLSVDSSSDNDVTDLCETYGDNKDPGAITKKPPSQIHSSNMRKHYFDCNDFNLLGDDEDYHDDDDDEEELNNHDDISDGSDAADMDTDEADSMTSLDTEKSAKLKRGNHPLLRDKLLAKHHQTDNNNSNNNRIENYKKPMTASIRNSSTDGLLSIAIKTIKLVKRNQLLQQRLTQLQLETSEFIQSVLANPENRHFRENIKNGNNRQEVDKV